MAFVFGTVNLVRFTLFCFVVSVVGFLCVSSTFAFVSVLRLASPPSFAFSFSVSVAFAFLATFAFVVCGTVASASPRPCDWECSALLINVFSVSVCAFTWK